MVHTASRPGTQCCSSNKESLFSCPVMPWNCLFNIPEICRWFAMRINPTSAHEVMWIYYNVSVVNLHVSAKFSGHLQEGIIRRISYKDVKINVLIYNIKFLNIYQNILNFKLHIKLFVLDFCEWWFFLCCVSYHHSEMQKYVCVC